MMRPSGYLALITTLLYDLPWQVVHAEPAHLPQPWRAQAVVQGRDEPYDIERFLHELTFRHRSDTPSALENGIRGTGGSVSSDELYYDFRFRQDFSFRDGRNGFLLDIQRSEDLDGTYDRQLIGFRQDLGESVELWLQGDVFPDKAQSDIYFSARHHLSEGSWLHASWILPDAYFNEKTSTSDEFTDPPWSAFVQWHQQAGPKQSTTVSINWSPESEFISRQESLTVTSDQLGAAVSQSYSSGGWLFRLHMEGERSRRQYHLQGPDEGGRPDFSRDYLKATASARFHEHRLKPVLGLAYIHLDEQGFFGRVQDESGKVRRREPMLFGEITLRASAGTTLSPGVYLSHPDIRQSFEDSRKRFNGFTGKLAVPVQFQLSEGEQATLTLNPTFYLHEAAFGGGNVQLHWLM